MLRTGVVDIVVLDIGNLDWGLTVTMSFRPDHHLDRNPTSVEDYLVIGIIFRAPGR